MTHDEIRAWRRDLRARMTELLGEGWEDIVVNGYRLGDAIYEAGDLPEDHAPSAGYGLWQINTTTPKLPPDAFTPEANARAAVAAFRRAPTWGNGWSTS